MTWQSGCGNLLLIVKSTGLFLSLIHLHLNFVLGLSLDQLALVEWKIVILSLLKPFVRHIYCWNIAKLSHKIYLFVSD